MTHVIWMSSYGSSSENLKSSQLQFHMFHPGSSKQISSVNLFFGPLYFRTLSESILVLAGSTGKSVRRTGFGFIHICPL